MFHAELSAEADKDHLCQIYPPASAAYADFSSNAIPLT